MGLDEMQQQNEMKENVEILVEPKEIFAGQVVRLESKKTNCCGDNIEEFLFVSDNEQHEYRTAVKLLGGTYEARWDTTGVTPMLYKIHLIGEKINYPTDYKVSVKHPISSTVISRSHPPNPTDDQALWVAIRNRTKAIGFGRYAKFLDKVFCNGSDSNGSEAVIKKPLAPSCYQKYQQQDGNEHYYRKCSDVKLVDEQWEEKLAVGKADLRINAADSYSVLRLATQVFLLLESGVVIQNEVSGLFEKDKEQIRLDNAGETLETIKGTLARYLGNSEGRMPYLYRILESLLGSYDPEVWKEKLAYCDGVLQHRFSCPSMLELIWSYWHEEGMLVQSMNAISLRFQNRRRAGKRDPLAHLEIDPLRGLNNLLWGYIQNEHNRLTLTRRSYEYDHHYGISLHGKAVPTVRSVDTRSKFLEGFHNVLNKAADFYRQNANNQIDADAFPLLNAIKQIHLCLAEGAHNQFGDLPWTARI
ncbi:MAG: hypothetical protein D3924_08030, partial [Candidatus Electrothrix sp. AR4]|nr:hypothetical protein [Candidatus Electrothrix sp. AR4]